MSWGRIPVVFLLFENRLLFDGELSIQNLEWFEEDNLVVFDLFYVVREERQKCICHYSHSGFFTYFTPISQDCNTIDTIKEVLNATSDDISEDDWW